MFKVQKAVRENVAVKVALMSPSGGGKTYSALRLATGMAEEIEKIEGKKPRILMGNTEAARGRYYANEFDYDIVDLDPPYNPEKFVQFIQFAEREGYQILIIDSASHEWEGKGGCLELHAQAGGRWQDWGKVNPRHEQFIEAMSKSPLHIISTMRGKDKYEMENDDKGKATVTKLGVGAKQREGFEYEFTCTFTIDQRTSLATYQKDNTHIFENDVAVILTEDHGRRLIKWANSDDGKNIKMTKAEEKVEEVKTEAQEVEEKQELPQGKVPFDKLKSDTTELGMKLAKNPSVGMKEVVRLANEIIGKSLNDSVEADYDKVKLLLDKFKTL
ncbi:AAA family ATPase [Tissierella praeacuta]|uniref:AAA family ATPase n=1 Tax=Tissierella praeacuta TaxID=43131 RepID=UPI003DA560BD